MLKFLVFVSLFVSSSSLPNRLDALWNFDKVAECVLGYSALVYNGYGCWCGSGGSGTPVDGIDECCKLHDLCYDKAVADKSCQNIPEEYFDDYAFKCTQYHRAVCTASSFVRCFVVCVRRNGDKCWKKYPRPTDRAQESE